MTYSQDWHAYNQAQTHEKELFQKLLFDLCNNIENPNYTFGRPTLPLSDMIFASALKVYTTFSCRRFISDMKNAKENGYCDNVCSYSTVSNYMRNPKLTSVLVNLICKSALPLKTIETKFAVDSSGFGTSRFDRWFSFKYGKEIDKRIWIKAHLINGVKTHIITGIKITEGYANDSPQFAELVNTTAKSFTIEEVSGDKAYSSMENLETVKEHGGTAYIPFKSNATARARHPKTWKKMYHYFMYNREEFLQHYHKRSNSETVFHMIKAKFGDYVRSKEWTAQVNEVLLKVLCHNICVVIQEMHELGIEPNFCLKSEVNV
jgi:transposase